MIYAVTAQTGGGKSYFCMRQIVKFLGENSTGHVVTNLAINIPELCEYLTEEYGDTCEVGDRVRILKLEEVGSFWMCFGVGFDLPGTRIVIRDGTGRAREELDYSCRDPKRGGSGHPVLYVIDEADEIFDAKSFAGMSHDLRYYVRHQRKFSDNVYLIAPAWEFLVKELRIMCHAVWVMENGQQMKLGKIPIVGSLFRGFPWIKGTMWKVRQGGAWGGLNEVPRAETRFLIDPKGVGRTYRTEDGLGVSGNTELVRKAEKVKGLSPLWIGAVVLVLGGLLLFAPRLMGKALGAGIGEVSKAAGQSIVSPPSVPVSPVQQAYAHTGPKGTKGNDTERVEVFSSVYVTGFVADRGVVKVFLSNGTVRSTLDPDFLALIKDGFGRPCGAAFRDHIFKFKEVVSNEEG